MSLIRLKRNAVNSDVENQILTGMIVSTEYLKKVQDVFDLSYFTNDYLRKVSKWVLDYYDKYKLAPSSHIQDIYKTEKENLKEADYEIIGVFLDSLSKKYDQDSNFNIDYLMDKTVNYFKHRSLALSAERILTFVGAGKIEEAEKEMQDYKKVTKAISGWVNPFEEKYISNVFDNYFSGEDSKELLFKLTGKVGDFLGHFERGWLIAFEAPPKRGKTFFLQEVALQSVMSRLNTVFISLEMTDQGVSSRSYKRLTGTGEKVGLAFPVFDCVRNQKGECTLPMQVNKIILVKDDGVMPDYDPNSRYKVCTICRGKKAFIPGSWFESIDRKKISFGKTKKITKGFYSMYGDRLRIKSYPAYSANLSTIKKDLEVLEYSHDFIPDVIVIDYADILAPESKQTEGRDRYDETWKMFKNLAATKHCLVVTASQSNRKTLEKKHVKASDISEDIRKVAHIDALFSLNQTPNEKKMGVMRVAVVSHRWKDFDELGSVMVLQNLDTSQVILDSE